MNNITETSVARYLPLLHAAACVAKVDITLAETAACKLLGIEDKSPSMAAVHSELNWNGSPLQLLFSFRRQKINVRLLGDPGSYLNDPLARYQSGHAAVTSMLSFSGAASLSPLTQNLIHQLVPDDAQQLRLYSAGTMWLATGLSRAGIALYVAPAPTSDRWQKAHDWVTTATRFPDEALRIIATLKDRCFLLGAGIEGQSPETARFKLYWRMCTPSPLSDFGIALLTEPALLSFLSDVMDDAPVSPDALNFSANFDVVSGKLVDVKVDVSLHTYTRDAALRLIARQADHFSLAHAEIQEAMDAVCRHSLDVGCIGLGIDTRREYRLNTYLFNHSGVHHEHHDFR